MSEQKRATLSTISTQKSDVKKVKELRKTIRFTLNLPESNEKSCPEYNYRDLLNAEEKKHKYKESVNNQPNGILNPSDPFNDDDDSDVKRIAQKFEAKYGTPQLKKRRGKKDDYADIGAGYDESDSFIDNTDPYDEMVPEDVTTLHGGFYINSGALEFKQVDLSGTESSESEDDEDEEDKSDKPTVNRKRIIEDTDESDSEDEETKTEHADKKAKLETNGLPKPIKKKLTPPEEKDLLIKKKKIEENPAKKKQITVKDLLREKREEIDLSLLVDDPEKDDKDSKKDIKPASLFAISSTINDVIESVVNAGRAGEIIIDEISKDSSNSDDVAVVSTQSSDSESSRDGVQSMVVVKDEPLQQQQQQSTDLIQPEPEMVKLPDTLPANVLELVNSIKEAAKNSEGKVKFFSGSVNHMFLNLEVICRKLGKSNRLQIYAHLAPFVKCKKDTLMRRAKNLVLDDERGKIKYPMKRLLENVEKLMPIVMKGYEKELQKYREEMFQANANANQLENGEINPKVKRAPRKKWPWSDEARKALQEIIILKRKCFILEGIRKETFEAHLEIFLKTAILPMWTDGWMSITSLSKQAKYILDSISKPKSPTKLLQQSSQQLQPISLDIHATTITPYGHHSPVKIASPSSAIEVIPIISPKSTQSTTITTTNGPKKTYSPSTTSAAAVHKVEKKPEVSVVPTTIPPLPSSITLNPELSIVTSSQTTKECLNVNTVSSNSLLIPATSLIPKTGTISVTNIDLLRTSKATAAPPVIEEPPVVVTPVKKAPPVDNNDRVGGGDVDDDDDDCQIIDLTDTPPSVAVVQPALVRKPGPKSKTRYVDGSGGVKKRPKDHAKIDGKSDEITGTQALNHIITGLTKYKEANPVKQYNADIRNYEKSTSGITNEDEMEQVMKDLKQLQHLQEHARKNDIDIMAPSSSPVSVIAFNSSYSPSRTEIPKERSSSKSHTEAATGYLDYQKHLYQDVMKLSNHSSPPTSLFNNTNVQTKSNFNNSISNYPYTSSGSISNTMNNLRYPPNSNKYTTPISHIPTTSTGSSNHNDDFALFQNFLYQYGLHNASGSKQKPPP